MAQTKNNNPIRRKIIKQSVNACTISLPIQWIRDQKLKPGDELCVGVEDHGLLISPGEHKNNEKKQVVLHVNREREPFLKAMLNNVYRLGYDSIRIQYDKEEQVQALQEFVDKGLLGFEVTKKEPHNILIQKLSEPEDDKHEILLKKLFFIIKESFATLAEDIQNKRFVNKEKLRTYNEKVSQYENFCRRNITKQKTQKQQVYFYWSFYRHLKLIQQSLYRLYEQLSKQNKGKVDEGMKESFKRLSKNFDRLYDGLFKRNLGILSGIDRSLKTETDLLLTKMSVGTTGINTVFLCHTYELSRTMHLATSPAIGMLVQ